MDIDEIEQLTRDIIAGTADVDTLTKEQAELIRKRINPYAAVKTSNKESFINISIHNWRDHYIRKLHITAFVGYLYRAVSESTEFTTKKKALLRKFLGGLFEFNPEAHIRSAASKPGEKPEFKIGGDAPPRASTESVKFVAVSESAAAAYQALNLSIETIRRTIAIVEDEDTKGILGKQLGILEQQRDKYAAESYDYLKQSHEDMAAITPPAELFYNYGRYFDSNFEQIRAITEAYYHEKPDIEFSIIYHDHFATQKEAEKHIRKYGGDLTHDMISVKNGGILLLGPFRENRERIGFYTENTNVLKAMMDQQSSDAALGKDLLKKRIATEKRKNIAESGLDAEGLSAYKNAVSVVGQLSNKESLTKQEREELDKAIYTKKQAEVPDGAIAVNAFFTAEEDGERVMKKTEFYTREEEPLHLTKDSVYNDKYQPI